jgi:hypothetical protein
MTAQLPKVLILELQERTSAAGNTYLAGWMGKARLVGFWADGEDRDGTPCRVLRVFAQEPGERPATVTQAASGPQEHHPHPPRAPERQGWTTMAPATSSEQRRVERAHKAAFEAQQRQDDAMTNLNDPIPD